jgi:hypothetical protein
MYEDRSDYYELAPLAILRYSMLPSFTSNAFGISVINI